MRRNILKKWFLLLWILSPPPSLSLCRTQICAVTWRRTVHEHIVADASRSKKSSSAILVHEQQASRKWCLLSRHSTPCGGCKRKVYENTRGVCAKLLKHIYIYIYINQILFEIVYSHSSIPVFTCQHVSVINYPLNHIMLILQH